MGLKCALLWPDTHVPFHHKKACSLALEVAQSVSAGKATSGGVDAIYLLGDFADFFYLSQHGPKHPGMTGHLVNEVDAVNEFLDQFDKLFPRAAKVYIQGNHEYRLERYIQNKAPELFGLVDCQTLFKLQSRPGWRWVPYSPHQRVRVLGSKLYARHEPIGTNARITAGRALCSLAFGHTHQIEESHIVGLDGSNHVAFSAGWLGDRRKDEVFGYVKNHHSWQLGFALVYVDDKSGLFYHQKIHILERGNKLSCVVNGKRFEK